MHVGDRRFQWVLRGIAIAVISLLVLILLQLLHLSAPALSAFGWKFLTTQTWNPVRDVFGSGAFVFGTVVSSLIALVFSVPVSVGVALFLNELAPARMASALGFLVEMLAAIPSVVYGLWGIFVLAPWLRATIQPFFIIHFGFLPIFRGPAYGVSMFTAGVVLAIMITPTIAAICREVFRAIPMSQREAALALGGTRWETIRISVIKSSRAGVLGAVILGLGRSLGETMAVTMVIGNRNEIAASLFAPAQTMASVIANEYAEATSNLHLSALAAVGLILFAVSFLINAIARFLVWKVKVKVGGK